ncbi:hypothetical protein ABW20_dc0107317 [Dactylellina cionopaga]|nr:hypothetical protein ABW20_dc0107317 [Dactylellina cionopaga]
MAASHRLRILVAVTVAIHSVTVIAATATITATPTRQAKYTLRLPATAKYYPKDIDDLVQQYAPNNEDDKNNQNNKNNAAKIGIKPVMKLPGNYRGADEGEKYYDVLDSFVSFDQTEQTANHAAIVSTAVLQGCCQIGYLCGFTDCPYNTGPGIPGTEFASAGFTIPTSVIIINPSSTNTYPTEGGFSTIDINTVIAASVNTQAAPKITDAPGAIINAGVTAGGGCPNGWLACGAQLGGTGGGISTVTTNGVCPGGWFECPALRMWDLQLSGYGDTGRDSCGCYDGTGCAEGLARGKERGSKDEREQLEWTCIDELDFMLCDFGRFSMSLQTCAGPGIYITDWSLSIPS